MTQLESCVPTLFRNSSLSEFLQVCNPRTSQPFCILSCGVYRYGTIWKLKIRREALSPYCIPVGI